MRRRTAIALFMLSLLALAGCGGVGTIGPPPPLVFPTAALGPSGPAPLSLYLNAGAAGASAQYSVSAFNASDGHQRWSRIFKERLQPGFAIDEGAIFVGAADHKVYALEAGSGAQRWSAILDGLPNVTGGINGTLYVSVNQDSAVQAGAGPIYALDESSGAVKWHSDISGFVEESRNGVVYVGSTDQNLYALNASDGSVRWKFQAAYMPQEVGLSGGQLYMLAGHQSNQGFTSVFYALDTSTGKQKWRYPSTDNQANVASAAVDASAVYLFSSTNNRTAKSSVLALNARTGKPRWQFPAPDLATAFESAVLANGVIYIGSSSGAAYALNVSTGKLRWHTQPGGHTFVTLVTIDHGIIYADVTSGGIKAINSKDGSVRWQSQPASFSYVAGLVNGVLYGYTQANTSANPSAHNTIFALNATSGAPIWTADAGAEPSFPVVA